jgi:hypothetical protein
VAVNFCVMVVAPWVSDLLLAWGAGRRHGVWVAGMGCGVWVWPCGHVGCRHVWLGKCGGKKWVWPCGLPVFLVGKAWEKKINILIEKQCKIKNGMGDEQYSVLLPSTVA